MKNRFRFHLCLICMFVFAVAGCKVKRPSDVISESKMENLLYDYHVAKSMGDNLPYSENYKKALYIDAVFKKYGTTQAAFDSSMVWYTRNTEILSKIYDKVKKRLKDEQELVGDLIAKRDKKPKMTKQGDSINVWPWQRMVRLTGEMMELIHSDAPNIVCIQPFACLPNHIVGKGVIKAIRKEYPKANIVAIDYDPGASEVNQLNRIKLMLSTAFKRLDETNN